MHQDCVVHDVDQGTDEWHKCRNGILTASEMKLVLTPTLKVSNNDKTRAHVYELAAQRISGWTEPQYVGDAMLRGHADEITARDLYNDKVAPVEELGFITRNIGGCVLGYSPDGSGIMDPFGIEIKSRLQKYQVQTIATNEVPNEYMLQLQTGLLVTGWEYMDFISYSGGLPMWRIKTMPTPEYQDAIFEGAIAFEKKVCDVVEEYGNRLSDANMVIETEREEPVDDVGIYVE